MLNVDLKGQHNEFSLTAFLFINIIYVCFHKILGFGRILGNIYKNPLITASKPSSF